MCSPPTQTSASPDELETHPNRFELGDVDADRPKKSSEQPDPTADLQHTRPAVRCRADDTHGHPSLGDVRCEVVHG